MTELTGREKLTMSEERGCLQAKTGAHGTILMLKYGHKPQKLTVITTTFSRKEAWKTQAAGMVEGQGGSQSVLWCQSYTT